MISIILIEPLCYSIFPLIIDYVIKEWLRSLRADGQMDEQVQVSSQWSYFSFFLQILLILKWNTKVQSFEAKKPCIFPELILFVNLTRRSMSSFFSFCMIIIVNPNFACKHDTKQTKFLLIRLSLLENAFKCAPVLLHCFFCWYQWLTNNYIIQVH